MNTPLEETLYYAARELGDPVARAVFLDKACGGDVALRAGIEARIQADGEGATVRAVAGGNVGLIPLERAGDTIDRYKLLQQIGEGGCGVVYMAEQSEPVRRRVALKVIKVGMDTKSVIARFEAERQALAMMDHSNIAKVLDAGTTTAGRPYFVMELVRGIPITKYCDQNNLPASQRLDLFIAVCHAIQHAHQKGIIHRDIKPSNILVTLHDGVPVPKVIDFGIAKATEARLTDLTLFTELHAFMGTPAYTSPEQAEMSGLDIDTRADIYSLGVLLYELLAGRLPFDPEKLLKAGLDEMRRTIREVEPPRPSTRLSTLTDAERTTIAKQRGLDPGQLSSLLRGDLDWIVMKTLEKDRTRRYDTANGLALDIQRYLGNEAVLARPPRTTYLLRKLMRRHRTVFAAAGAVVVALMAGITVSTWEAVRATRAERTAGEELYAASMVLAQGAWEESNISRLRGLLEETRMFPDRGFEWYYWQRLTHLELRTLRGHTSGIGSVAFSPDGRWILTGSGDKTAKLWDVDSGRELLTFKGHAEAVTSIAFSPDGQRVLTGSKDETAKVWDAKTGLELLTLKMRTPNEHIDDDHTDSVTAVGFSPDGRRIVTGSEDRWARIWDAESGGELFTLKEFSGVFRAVVYSRDGKRIVTASKDVPAKLWDAESGQPLLTLKDSGGIVHAVAFSPDGRRILTGGEDERAKVWDAEKGDELYTLEGHEGPVTSVAFSTDGRWMLTGSSDKTAKLWDVKTAGIVFRRDASDKRSHSGSPGQPEGRELLTLTGHDSGVTSVAFSPDGRWILTGSEDETAKIWNTKSDRELLTLNGHTQSVTSVAVSGDGRRIVTGCSDGTAKVWDAESGRELLTIQGNDSTIYSVGFSPDARRVVTGSKDKVAMMWDAETGRDLLTFSAHTGPVRSVVFSADGRRIATGSMDHTARIWEAGTGRELVALLGHTGGVRAVAFSRDGRRVVTGSADHTAMIWDAETGREARVLKGHTGEVTAVVFSPDGQRILTGSMDKTTKLWDATSGRELLTLKRHDSAITSVAFSPDSHRILTGSADKTAKLWDAKNGRELLTLKGHSGEVTSVVFSPDGRRIFTGSEDHTADIWVTASLEEVEAWRKGEVSGNEETQSRRQQEEDSEERQQTREESLRAVDSAIDEENWDKATAKLATVEKLTPSDQQADLDMRRFKILIGKKDYPAVDRLAETMSDAHQSDADLQGDLAWRIAIGEEVGQHDLSLAEKIATRANEAANWKDADVLDTLARILFMQGKKEAAIQRQEQAVKLAEGSEKEGLQKTLDSYLHGHLPPPE